MKDLTIFLALIILFFSGIATSSAQNADSVKSKPEYKLKPVKKKEPQINWGLNLAFSDNGFGFGATKYFALSRDASLLAGVIFSAAKDDREFDQYDAYGNSITPFKENRLFLAPVLNLGAQFRLFRDDVSDNMRPYINFGISPTVIIFTPYRESFFKSFGYSKVKYAVGGFAGFGMDYLTDNRSSLSFNIRYYYIGLLGDGIRSISTTEKKQFGGLTFMFSYNFMK
jgi:outer membrane protein W